MDLFLPGGLKAGILQIKALVYTPSTPPYGDALANLVRSISERTLVY
jgi:hypothetical protein